MKKFCSIVLCAVMIMMVTVPSFAFDNTSTDPVSIVTPRSTSFGPYFFDLSTFESMDVDNGFARYYTAGTTVRISGEWRGEYPLFFVFTGVRTGEDISALVYSGASKTITLPAGDDWTCFVASNGGRTDGAFWLYVT